MTAVALDLLREVAAAGGAVHLQGDGLRVSAPEPLPDDLRARLRQHKAEIVAVLVAEEMTTDAAPEPPSGENLANLPQKIVDGVRAILLADRAQGIPPQRWPRVQHDVAQLVDGGWLHQALALGWTAADLFGCDQRAPWYRLDRAGLVLMIGEHEIIELSKDNARLTLGAGPSTTQPCRSSRFSISMATSISSSMTRTRRP